MNVNLPNVSVAVASPTETSVLGRVEKKTGIDVGTVLRNVGIGAGAGTIVGGLGLLTKVKLPLIGKVTSLAGLGRLAGAGAGIGLAAAVLPVLWPKLDQYPAAKAALTGAAIGGSVGAAVPFLSSIVGAIGGAVIGLGVHVVSKVSERKPWANTPFSTSPPNVPGPPELGRQYQPLGQFPGAGYPMSGGYPMVGTAPGYGMGYGTAMPMGVGTLGMQGPTTQGPTMQAPLAQGAAGMANPYSGVSSPYVQGSVNSPVVGQPAGLPAATNGNVSAPAVPGGQPSLPGMGRSTSLAPVGSAEKQVSAKAAGKASAKKASSSSAKAKAKAKAKARAKAAAKAKTAAKIKSQANAVAQAARAVDPTTLGQVQQPSMQQLTSPASYLPASVAGALPFTSPFATGGVEALIPAAQALNGQTAPSVQAATPTGVVAIPGAASSSAPVAFSTPGAPGELPGGLTNAVPAFEG